MIPGSSIYYYHSVSTILKLFYFIQIDTCILQITLVHDKFIFTLIKRNSPAMDKLAIQSHRYR